MQTKIYLMIYKKFHGDPIFCWIVIGEKQGYTAYEILSKAVDMKIALSEMIMSHLEYVHGISLKISEFF